MLRLFINTYVIDIFMSIVYTSPYICSIHIENTNTKILINCVPQWNKLNNKCRAIKCTCSVNKLIPV